jgi:glycosyltransferase involved in cell wall biosynthesis
MRVALVHDWLTGMRGGEKCLQALCRVWPDAHLYTLIHRRGCLSEAIERMEIRTSFLQRVPGVFEHYRYFLPLMPLAMARFRLSGYDLVLSLSHCVAKSVHVPPGAPHVCYCFTPMRYAWHMREAYFGTEDGSRKTGDEKRTCHSHSLSSRVFRASSSLREWTLAGLRRWDRRTADRVTHFVAISRTVRQRIRECYGRDSVVIHPPVDVGFYTPELRPREDFYLCVSALVPYKRTDLAITACNRLRRKLIVIGSGPEEPRLRAMAGPSVSLLGWQSDGVIRDHYRRCRALLFPGVEDFGIVPVEAQACGAPVIALGSGGATETIIAATATRAGTGLFFSSPTAESLVRAIEQFEAGRVHMSPQLARAHAENYCESHFVRQIQRLADQVLGRAQVSPPSTTSSLAA